jgi:DNA invertase Pin-like site-specific DNA recombinase
MFSLFAELERDLISQRTKEALATKKECGIKLGRPKGPGRSKLDLYKEQIQEFLDKDVSMLSIAKIIGVSYPTLFHYVKQRKMLKLIIPKVAHFINFLSCYGYWQMKMLIKNVF